MAGMLVKFQLSPFPRKQSTKHPQKMGEIWSKTQNKTRAENSKNSENFRSVTFLTLAMAQVLALGLMCTWKEVWAPNSACRLSVLTVWMAVTPSMACETARNCFAWIISPDFHFCNSDLVNFVKHFTGPYPQYGWDFPEEIPEKSGETMETLSERFLEFPSPYNSRHLKLPERFQTSLPPSTARDASFSRIGSGEGLSELVMEFPAVLGVFLIHTKRMVYPDRGPAFRAKVWVSRESAVCDAHTSKLVHPAWNP